MGHKYLGFIARDEGDEFGAAEHFDKFIAAHPGDRAVEQARSELGGG